MNESVWQFEEWIEQNSPFKCRTIYLKATEVVVKHDSRTGYQYIVPTSDSKVFTSKVVLTAMLAELKAQDAQRFLSYAHRQLYQDIARSIALYKERH